MNSNSTLKIITTVGTSIFTNYQKNEIKKVLGDSYESIDGVLEKFEKLPAYEYQNQKNYGDLNKIKNEIINKWLVGITKNNEEWELEKDSINIYASAEISSLIYLINSNQHKKISIFLLASDTILSVLAAECIKEFFNKNSQIISNILLNIEIKTIDRLDVHSKDSFENVGLPNLSNQIVAIVNNHSPQNANVLLNISGGYKGIIPFVTIIGQVLEIDIYYLYENTNNLIKIPQMPLQINQITSERYFYHLTALKNNLHENANYKLSSEIFNELFNLGLVSQYASKHKISFLGNLFINLVENSLNVSKSVLGHIVELKLFEFFTTNPLKSYPFIERGNELLNNNGKKNKGGEIDLLFRKTTEITLNETIISEVKSFFQFANNVLFEKVLLQFQAKINLLTNNNYLPDEIRFYIYTIDKKDYNDSNSRVIKNRFDKLQEKAGRIRVKFYFVLTEVKKKKISENPYLEFMAEKIEFNRNLKEIILN
ncbi:MAG: hypothetical protein K8F60_03720 [Melioribacteraceae bacterium]|nr:hypothetical protein [Melioribacteraceae bacterium]